MRTIDFRALFEDGRPLFTGHGTPSTSTEDATQAATATLTIVTL